MKKSIALILCLCIVFAFAGCGTSENLNDDGKYRIVCSAFPQYDFVRELTRSLDDVEVTLLNTQSDIHSYEPTAEDIAKISQSNMFIYNDLNAEKWVQPVLDSVNNSRFTSIALTLTVSGINESTISAIEEDEHEDEDENAVDEHVWLSLKNANIIVTSLRDMLSADLSDDADTIMNNAETYLNKIDKLDKDYSTAVQSAKKDTLIFGDRFPFIYLLKDYNIKYCAAFPGCSSETSASFETVTALIEKAKEVKSKVILYVDGSDGSVAKAIADESGAKTLQLNSCQNISQSDIDAGVNYYDIMVNNLEVIKEALN